MTNAQDEKLDISLIHECLLIGFIDIAWFLIKNVTWSNYIIETTQMMNFGQKKAIYPSYLSSVQNRLHSSTLEHKFTRSILKGQWNRIAQCDNEENNWVH